jgi:cytochrome c
MEKRIVFIISFLIVVFIFSMFLLKNNKNNKQIKNERIISLLQKDRLIGKAFFYKPGPDGTSCAMCHIMSKDKKLNLAGIYNKFPMIDKKGNLETLSDKINNCIIKTEHGKPIKSSYKHDSIKKGQLMSDIILYIKSLGKKNRRSHMSSNVDVVGSCY